MARFCTNCGAALEEDKKFCTQCGTVMEGGEAPKPLPPRPAPQPQCQAVPQPAYGGDTPPPPGSKYEPITTGGYIGIMLLMCIPLVGQVLAIVWALGGCKKINKRNLARASLVMMIVALILGMAVGAVVKSLVGKVVDAVEQETGVTISADKDQDGGLLGGLLGGGKDDEKEQEQSGSLLGGLTGLIGGIAGESGATNSDLEALEELEGLLGTLGEDNSGLSDAIDDIKDINAEAEANNSGWPKSLRKYPGGTAKATASYRTEISGTTAEEMMDWIDDLKGDGFKYQDFYDFGMTEEDMLGVNGWWATDGKIYISLSYSDGTVIVDHMNELPDMSALLGG